MSYSKLETLSEKEREYALKILSELSKGNSDSYNNLIYADYAEIPVDINTFLHDKKYLGNGLTDKEGRFTVFPYWVDVLNKLFPNNLDTAYNTLILSGAIGIGKSFVAVISMLYLLYRMLCLKDPYQHYGLQPIDNITFSMLNLTLDAAKGVGWSKMQELLKSSPWFMKHGRMDNKIDSEWHPDGNIELIYGSQTKHIIGRAVFANFLDEASFRQNQDISKQKEYALELVNTADARMQSRFMHGEKSPTLHIIASSKRTDQSFLESYIDMKKRNESKTTLIVDEPQWVIRTDKNSNRFFHVALGNKFLESEVLDIGVDEKTLSEYRDKGYKILDVPMGYYESFIDDLGVALTDIAGVSVSNSMGYISGERWARCRDDSLRNPFTKEILTIGNAPDDEVQYKDFFDMSAVPQDMMHKPLYIHLDMSLTGDKTGIAGVWIKGKKPPVEGQPPSKELYFQLAFSVSIKAPKGHQVSFEKNRQFIYWLKEVGFNIKGISTDTFQAYDTGQALRAKGYEVEILSVDRVNSDHICEPYQYFKSTIYEERVITYKTTLLTEEIVGLLRDGNGKIDHSPAGINSKDQADAVCGSIFTASKNAEQYAYDYGEDYDIMVKFNGENVIEDKKQVTIDFEEELRKVVDGMSNITFPQVQKSIRKREVPDSYYLYDGIII